MPSCYIYLFLLLSTLIAFDAAMCVLCAAPLTVASMYPFLQYFGTIIVTFCVALTCIGTVLL